MSMEGTTRIELTDVRTGRTEVREHKNRVTGAVQEIFTPLGLYTSAEMLQPQDGEDANSPLAYAFGGLLLLDTAVGSSEDALLIPPGAQITGTAAHGAPNNGRRRKDAGAAEVLD